MSLPGGSGSQPNYPEYGEARPVPPQPEYVQIRLPTDPARAVWVLLAINIAVYILSGVLSVVVTGNLSTLFTPVSGVLRLLGWKDNLLIMQGEYWRLLTATFLHGNLLHILFNGYALYLLGQEVERVFGTARFLATYFLAGLAGSIASYALSVQPSVGASGAIFGLIGALSIFYYLNRQVLGDAGRSQLQSMAAIVVLNLLIGFGGRGVIDNYAHIGGLIGGAIAGWMLAPRYRLDQVIYPPMVMRQFVQSGWIGAGVFLLVLMVLAWFITPPFF